MGSPASRSGRRLRWIGVIVATLVVAGVAVGVAPGAVATYAADHAIYTLYSPIPGATAHVEYHEGSQVDSDFRPTEKDVRVPFSVTVQRPYGRTSRTDLSFVASSADRLDCEITDFYGNVLASNTSDSRAVVQCVISG